MVDTVLFSGFALAYLVLLAWGVGLARRRGTVTPADVALLVVAGLVYDNAVLASGRFVGEGQLLETLNLARFWIHAFLTPLLVVVAWYAAARAGVGWARSGAGRAGAWLLAAGLVVLELVTVVADLSLEPERAYGVLSYADTSDGGGPPLMVLVVAAALVLAGFVVWRRQRWPWLLAGALVMTAGSAVPLPVDSGAVTNAFELVLLASVLATTWSQDESRGARVSPGRRRTGARPAA